MKAMAANDILAVTMFALFFGIGLVLGVDRLLDMCRTTLNLTGDLVAATVIAAGEANGRQAA
jgi:Na+/H+-dicarboxylate symporter